MYQMMIGIEFMTIISIFG